ncbi:MAG: 4Fe-4S binding protein [Peptococcaceae bacterium]|nr:4Fe-4S binding protein [Peptococcaceae bacterium]
MGHLTESKEAVYQALAERLARYPVGVVVNETLMEILHRLFTVSEAEVGSKFPLLPMTIDKVAEVTGAGLPELRQTLENMAEKGLVMDLKRGEETYYMLSPMVVGFFEYTFMRVGNVNLKEMAGLFEKYLSSAEVREELFGSSTKMFRGLVYEKFIQAVVEKEVLSYERASELIRQSGGGSIGMCACRHKAAHQGKACDAPVDVCTSLGASAQWLVRRGFAREATVDELLWNLERTERHGLVHIADNVLNKPAFICHCCGCCCGLLRTINESGVMSLHPSNFIPEVNAELCLGCGQCEERCHVHAISMGAGEGGRDLPVVDRDACIGCGVCAGNCPAEALTMARREVLHVPPKNKKEQMMLIAGERNRF